MTDVNLNILGKRIDKVRATLAMTKPGTWANNYWTVQLNALVRQLNREGAN